MKREKDIMDVWFDSGISPWASLGYPFMNKGLFEQLWPVDLVDESQDQIRGWFYSLTFCGVSVFNKNSYDTCGLMGWVLDEKGEKLFYLRFAMNAQGFSELHKAMMHHPKR
jgi:isoleucyl-tRNA synthetase